MKYLGSRTDFCVRLFGGRKLVGKKQHYSEHVTVSEPEATVSSWCDHQASVSLPAEWAQYSLSSKGLCDDEMSL